MPVDTDVPTTGQVEELQVTEEKKQPRAAAALHDSKSFSVEPAEGEVEDAQDGGPDRTSDPAPKRGGKKPGESRKLSKKEILSLLTRKNEKILELAEQTKAYETEIKSLKDRWLRSAADFENYRKRNRKEWELLQQQAKAEVILEILNVVDDFERAFSVVGDRDDEFVQGIRLIFNNLIGTLEKLNVTRIEALGSAFDPNYHMAVAHLEKEGKVPNDVIEIVQHGYLLGDTVIRPAKVVIAK
jgi:molecular chaperone GrpE